MEPLQRSELWLIVVATLSLLVFIIVLAKTKFLTPQEKKGAGKQTRLFAGPGEATPSVIEQEAELVH